LDWPRVILGFICGVVATGPMTAAMVLWHRWLPAREKYPLPPPRSPVRSWTRRGHASDSDYQERVGSRFSDHDTANWLTPEEFERQLDQKQPIFMRRHEVYMHFDLLASVPRSGIQRRKIMAFRPSGRSGCCGDFSPIRGPMIWTETVGCSGRSCSRERIR